MLGIGLQGATGSAVYPDHLLRAVCELKPKVTKIHPVEDIASFAPTRHYVGAVEAEGNIKMDATYEELTYLLCMALNYDEPSGSYLWEFALPYQTQASTYLFTLEFQDAGPYDKANAYTLRTTDTLGTGLTISGEAGAGWQVEMPIGARKIEYINNISDNINAAVDETVTPIKMAETTLQVDSAYGSIGGTTVEELISFNWKIEGLKHMKRFAGSLYPNGHGYGRWKTTLELVLDMNPEVLTFGDAVLATTQFAVRIKGYASATDYCYIDGVYMVEDISTLDDRDGNNTIKVTLLGEKDSSDNVGLISLQNDISAV
jgi:hypothetical protein